MIMDLSSKFLVLVCDDDHTEQAMWYYVDEGESGSLDQFFEKVESTYHSVVKDHLKEKALFFETMKDSYHRVSMSITKGECFYCKKEQPVTLSGYIFPPVEDGVSESIKVGYEAECLFCNAPTTDYLPEWEKVSGEVGVSEEALALVRKVSQYIDVRLSSEEQKQQLVEFEAELIRLCK
jgi:hypothetical protein